ncbi:MAG: ParA family protein [Candidatus Bathyarchaeota archaeon]
MGQTIAFLNMKGGVGKTTVAINLAYFLAYRENKRVLMIDLDPQYNATQYLVDIKTNEDMVSGEKPTVYNILFSNDITYNSILEGIKTISHQKLELEDYVRKISTIEGKTLDLIPSTIHIINHSFRTDVAHKLQNFILKYKDAYDYIFVDCPPTFSVFLISGIVACDYYLVPVKPDPLSVLGIPLLEEVIDKTTEMYGSKIEPLGIIFTMFRQTNLMNEIMSGVRKTQSGRKYVFQNRTRNSTYYSKASEKHVPLWGIYEAQRDGHVRDFELITKEFLALI